MITGSGINSALYRVLRSLSMARSIARSALDVLTAAGGCLTRVFSGRHDGAPGGRPGKANAATSMAKPRWTCSPGKGGAMLALALVLLMRAPSPLFAQTARTDLAKARTLYNQRQFDEAISAASQARRQPDLADMAAIVLARAHLERYRERADPSDLSAAREALNAVRATSLDQRDQVELILALGQSLFLEDDFGAAAEMLESGLERAASADPALSEAFMEWWGSSIERVAGTMSRDPRHVLFRRLFVGARDELARHPTSAAAIYWTAAALRGAGELERAWDSAVAGWVRSRLIGERSAALRADLDRLVLQGIVPDRVRHLVSEQQAGAESQLKADWELVKETWK
jgi:tetratricopeptide (TPR) repeat protein